MRRLLFSLLFLPAVVPALAPETVLLADFSNKPLDQPIGTGGAAAGEPVQLSPLIEARVRAAPGGGRELELSKEPSSGTASIRFEFLDSEEVTTGQMRFRVALRLGTADQFSRVGLLLRERPGSAQAFLNLNLFSDGEAQIRRSGFPLDRFDNSVSLSALNLVEILYDLDEKTFSLCLNGRVLASALDLGIETARGIGSVLISLPAEGDTLAWLDGVEVQKGSFEDGTSDVVFADRFDDAPPTCPF
ncbi:MAG: hypothetical protein V2J42_15265 [Wenzhouxiangella sp.]|jgi:hypothetical protein|nr:hypothetical protein [Wenzhouxiangella sp.]